MKPIDPIVLREEQQRMVQKQRDLETGQDATKALLWFSQYAMDALGERGLREIRGSALKGSPQLVASSTQDHELAQRYVDRAAEAFRRAILESAIEIAQREYDAGVAARKS